MRRVITQHVSPLVQWAALRRYSSQSARVTSAPDARDPFDSTDMTDRDTFGTLSRSGSMSLQVQKADRTIPDDLDGYDKVEFDIAARKNAYYYKYEIPKYARQGPIGLRRALELFREMKSEARLEPTVDAFSTLIYGCAKAGYTKRAFDLYEESLRYFRKPTNSVITCLINACAESPFPEYGLQRLEWFLTHIKVEFNKQLNEIQYNSAIKAYGKLGRLNEASKLVQEMIDNDVLPTVDTFNMLLIGCASDRESGCAIAFRVFKRLKMYDFKPTVITYRLLLRCIRQCGMGPAELIEETLKELPAVTSLNQRLEYKKQTRGKGFKHKLQTNFEWMPLLTDLGRSIETAIRSPSVRDDQTLLQPIEYASQPIPAKKSTSAKKSTLNLPSSPAPLKVRESDQENNGLVSFHDANQHVLPNLLSDDHLDLTARIKSIQFDQLKYASQRIMLFGGIFGYLTAMLKDNCRPDAKTFSLMLECVTPTRENYLEYHKMAIDMEVKRDLSYYDQLVRFVCEHARVDDRIEFALHFVEQMHLDNLRPNISTYEALSAGCDTWAKSKQLLNDIERAGFAVSPRVIAKFLHRAGKDMNFHYLNNLLDYCCEIQYKPLHNQVEELENLRIRVNNLILKHERGEATPGVRINEKFVRTFDKFRSKLKSWLKSTELAEEDHPWAQFKVDTSSKRDGFRAYTRHFKAMEQLKSEAMNRGDSSFGNLSYKAEKLLRTNV